MQRSDFPQSISKGKKMKKPTMKKSGSKMTGMGAKKGMGSGKPAMAKTDMPEMPAFKKGGMVKRKGC